MFKELKIRLCNLSGGEPGGNKSIDLTLCRWLRWVKGGLRGMA